MARFLRLALLVSVWLLVVMVAAARAQTGRPSADQRWHALTDGAYAYNLYCAGCHGATGAGDGPKASRVAARVPDLRFLPTRSGRVDRTAVVEHIYATNTWQRDTMPAWGAVIRAGSGHSDAYAFLAAHNLMRHVESLQALQAHR
jgi:hypothetical protein